MVSWGVVGVHAPLAACMNGPPKGLTVGLLGFFLTEDAGWGANPYCSRGAVYIPAATRLSGGHQSIPGCHIVYSYEPL